MPSDSKDLHFRPRWWAFLLALTACGALLLLGNWQTRRASEKRQLAASFELAERTAPIPIPFAPARADALVLKHLEARGEFVPKFTVLLDNKVYKGRVGYFVVTPLKISGSELHVLVNRGWLPAGARREDIPAPITPAGTVSIEGIGLAHAPRVLSSGQGKPEGKVWQGLANEDFARWSGLALQPVFLEQRSALNDGLVRDWPRPDFGIDKHESYAMQWYLIAGLCLVLFVVLSFQRVRPAAR